MHRIEQPHDSYDVTLSLKQARAQYFSTYGFSATTDTESFTIV